MAFEGLSSKLQNIFRKLGGKGKLTEKEVKEAMREIKLALLEADVNFSVKHCFGAGSGFGCSPKPHSVPTNNQNCQ